MAVIPYSIKENKTLGTHSFYTAAQTFSTLTCEDMKEEIVEGLGIAPDMVPTIIKRYMRVALRNVQRGHRVKLADELVLYPQLSCSVKDELNPDGTVKTPATADMINAQQGRSTIGATISQTVQQEFSKNVSWKRVGEKEEDDTTTDPTTDSSSSDNGGNGGGTTNPPSGGDGNEGE